MTTEEVVLLPGRPAESRLLGLRLSMMMFLQYAVWGFWLPVLGEALHKGLGFSEAQIGWLLGLSASVGALTAPFVAGQIADRYFSTERVMAGLLIVGGVLWWTVSTQTSFAAWMVLLMLSSIAYVPTIALSNSLAFAHMADPGRQFPRVRVWGTIGWIVAGWGFMAIWLKTDLHLQWLPPFFAGKTAPDITQRLLDSLKAAAMLSFVYAAYCLTLPHTPPKREAVEPLAFRKAFKLFRFRSFTVLMTAGLIIASIHQIYFIQTSKFLPTLGLDKADILPAMSTAQFAEIIVMVFLGYLLKHLGFRWVLAIGGLAYVIRFTVFGTTSLPLWVIVGSQSLHGVCFACFYAAVFIYVERLAEEDVRHSAQTVVGILLGVGPFIGGLVSGALAGALTPEVPPMSLPVSWYVLAAADTGPLFGGSVSGALAGVLAPGDRGLDFSTFWYTIAVIGAVATLILAILFRDQTREARPPLEAGAPPASD